MFILCFTIAVVCFLPEAVLLVILRAERAAYTEPLEIKPMLKEGKDSEVLEPMSVAEPQPCISMSLLVEDQVTLPATIGICPACQQQTELFILKANGQGCACAHCWQLRYKAADNKSQRGKNLLLGLR
jgi:hypothetical protein